MTDDLLEEAAPRIPPGFKRMEWFSGFGHQIGPLYERIDEDGSYVRAFLVCDHHLNGMGNCHGGMLMAFADTAFGHVVSIKRESFWVTVRLLTDFISGAKKDEWVEGTGVIVGENEGMVTVEGRLWCGDRTIMTGSGVFKVLGPRPPRDDARGAAT